MADARRPRVLLLSYAFPPLAAPEAWLAAKAARSLQVAGADVEVVAATPAWWHTRDESLLGYAEDATVGVHRVRTAPWLPFALPARRLRRFPDVMRALRRRAVRLAESLDVERFDAMITWSQWHSVHLAGTILKRRHPSIRWLAHFSDPWAANPMQPTGAFTRRVNERLERAVLDAVDVVEFTTSEARSLTAAVHPGPWLERAVVVPHVFDPSLYDDRPAAAAEIVVRYVGSFYGSRTPDALFAGLSLVARDDPDALDGVVFEIVGQVEQKMLRTDLARALPQGLLRVTAPVSYRHSLALMRAADALLLVDAPAENNVFLASKLVDYLGAERPIIGITPPGTAATLVADSGGWVAHPSRPDQCAAAIRAGVHAARERAPRWGSDVAREPFRLDRVGRDRLALLAGLPGAGGGGAGATP